MVVRSASRLGLDIVLGGTACGEPAVLDGYMEPGPERGPARSDGCNPALVDPVIRMVTGRSASGASTCRPEDQHRDFGRDRRLLVTSRWREPLRSRRAEG